MKLLLSSNMTSQFVRQAARAFLDAGMLSEFWTNIARGPKSVWDPFMPKKIREEMRRRSFDPEILARTRTLPIREGIRLLATRAGFDSLVRAESGAYSVNGITRYLDRRVSDRLSRDTFDAVYAYEDGARLSFRTAKNRGVRCIYELPIGYWRVGRRIFEEEAELQPEWASTLEGLNDSKGKTEGKDEEARLADTIIVPSQFVANSLRECPGVTGDVRIVNYGCPTPELSAYKRPKGALRVLFVGSLSARKGLPYVLEAVKGLDVELTLIGSRPGSQCQPLEKALSTHRYLGSIPRNRVLEEMRSHDVFAFPTLFEGLANVLLEAISQGLVPITTASI